LRSTSIQRVTRGVLVYGLRSLVITCEEAVSENYEELIGTYEFSRVTIETAKLAHECMIKDSD